MEALESSWGSADLLPALRKLHEVGSGQLLGLAAIALMLGIVYWLTCERDDLQPGVPQRED